MNSARIGIALLIAGLLVWVFSSTPLSDAKAELRAAEEILRLSPENPLRADRLGERIRATIEYDDLSDRVTRLTFINYGGISAAVVGGVLFLGARKNDQIS